MLNKLILANLPTPITHYPALEKLVKTQVWVKRDDMSAGAEAGNKIRKLEYLLAQALNEEATCVMTCGGFQSNHARATALLARGLGMKPILFLRAERPDPIPFADKGNAFLNALVGARIQLITPEQYQNREQLMREEASALTHEGERVYVIPEGGSNGLGALGYVDAMREIRQQLDAGLGGGPAPFDAIVHACGSGGTAAGVCLGAAHHKVAERTIAMAVCNDKAYFQETIQRIIEQVQALNPALNKPNQLHVIDQFKGPAYTVPTREQVRFITEVAQTTGLIFDPVYTGKALFGLAHMDEKPKRALFIHTGGLPGLLAQTEDFSWLHQISPRQSHTL